MITEEAVASLYKRLHREVISPCKKCGGTGYVSYIPKSQLKKKLPITKSRRCDCLKQVMRKLDLARANVPPEFWETDGYKWKQNVTAYKLVRRYQLRIKRAKDAGLGFLFTGNPGAGKTTLATQILDTAIKKGFSAFYISVPEYMRLLRRGFSRPEINEMLDLKLAVDFLVLDELGKEHKRKDNNFALSEIDSLIRNRRFQYLPTIIVTNMDAKEFTSVYQSIGTLVADRFKVVRFKPVDMRERKADNWDKVIS